MTYKGIKLKIGYQQNTIMSMYMVVTHGMMLQKLTSRTWYSKMKVNIFLSILIYTHFNSIATDKTRFYSKNFT